MILNRIRDRWLGRPEVRAMLGRLPIGRRIADRHARRLFGHVAGFVQSQMLAAGLESGLLAALLDQPLAPASLAERCALDPRGFAALVQALTAMGLLEWRGSLLALTLDGRVVATDSAVAAMVAHNRLLYADLADPVALLRHPGAGQIAGFWPYASAGQGADYVRLMAASRGFVMDTLLATVDFARFRHVMDVGGADGSLLVAIAERYAPERLTLVDLPAVLAAARPALAQRCPRIDLVKGGDSVPLPSGADAITLMRVLHDRDDDDAAALLHKAAAALAPGGVVVVAEPMARNRRDPQTAYFAAYFAAMGSGRLRTREAIERMLRRAGLVVRERQGKASYLGDVILAGHKQS